MAHTATTPADAPTLRDNPALRFRSRTHGYEIQTSGGRSLYIVTAPDGTSSSTPLAWAFGAGKVGQTYLYEKDGAWQEGRLSYFSGHGGDFTPARAIEAPKDLAEAMGRPIPDAEARRCFACHNTASTAAGVFDTKAMIAGITCEACHGPGRKHVEALQQKKLGPALDAILNPAKLDPAASVDFCGACHATFWDVKLANEQGIAALRSQPNRLQSSKCWGAGDVRLTCVAATTRTRRWCAGASFRCALPELPCRRSASPATRVRRTTLAAPASRAGCVTCHMPKQGPACATSSRTTTGYGRGRAAEPVYLRRGSSFRASASSRAAPAASPVASRAAARS